MPGVIVDIGTGDGEFVYSLARENPDRFIIGLDPHQQGLENTSARIYKKPEKGGLKNVLFVLGSIEAMPPELDGIANQVFINFPWAGLLKGLLLADAAVWNALKRICQPGAFVDVLFSYEIATDAAELQKADLPAIDEAYLKNTVGPRLNQMGFMMTTVNKVTAEDIKRYPSTWAKKLSFGRDREYYYLRVKTD
jgi:16S rRNA (adenine(1408)-N(1))-methyltransferase